LGCRQLVNMMWQLGDLDTYNISITDWESGFEFLDEILTCFCQGKLQR
jgi:hypothetical protein